MKISGLSVVVAALVGATAFPGPAPAAIIQVDLSGTVQVEQGVDLSTVQPGDLWSASFLYDPEASDINPVDPTLGAYSALSNFTVNISGISYAVPLADSFMVVRNGFNPTPGTFIDLFGITGDMAPAFGIAGARISIQGQETCRADALLSCTAFGLISSDLLPQTGAAFEETLLYFINPTSPTRFASFNISVPPGPIASGGPTVTVRGNVTGVRAMAVPEPDTLMLMLTALGGLLLVVQARRRARDETPPLRTSAAALI